MCVLLCIFCISFPAAEMGVVLSLLVAFLVLANELEVPMWAWAALSGCACICCPCLDDPDWGDWGDSGSDDCWENMC